MYHLDWQDIFYIILKEKKSRSIDTLFILLHFGVLFILIIILVIDVKGILDPFFKRILLVVAEGSDILYPNGDDCE
jgi:hypothetical protein